MFLYRLQYMIITDIKNNYQYIYLVQLHKQQNIIVTV